MPRPRPRAAKAVVVKSPTPGRGRLLSKIPLAIALLITAVVLGRFGKVVLAELAYPYDIGFESANLATIRLVQDGKPVYDPEVYNRWPFVLTMYTPLYHWVVAQLPAVADRPFLVGRLVSLGCMAGTAGLLFLVGRPTRPVWLPLLAVGALCCIRPLVAYSAFLRIDSLGLLLSTGALLCVAQKSAGRKLIVLAGLLAAGAFLTKQSFLTCSLSCALFLLLRDRRQAAVFLGVMTGGAAAGFAVCYLWQGGSGVWFCWFVAPGNPLHWDIFRFNLHAMLVQPVFPILLLFMLVSVTIGFRRQGFRLAHDSPFFLHLGIAGLAVMATTAKVGAASNNYFELVFAGLLWLLHSWRHVAAECLAKPAPFAALLAFIAAMLGELRVADRLDLMVRPVVREFVEGQLEMLQRETATMGANRLKLLNLSDHMWVNYSVSEDYCLNDPMLYAVLWETGKLSEQPLLEAIERGEFDLILLPLDERFPNVHMPHHQTRAWRSIVKAVETRYREKPRKDHSPQSLFRFMLPKEP